MDGGTATSATGIGAGVDANVDDEGGKGEGITGGVNGGGTGTRGEGMVRVLEADTEGTGNDGAVECMSEKGDTFIIHCEDSQVNQTIRRRRENEKERKKSEKEKMRVHTASTQQPPNPKSGVRVEVVTLAARGFRVC